MKRRRIIIGVCVLALVFTLWVVVRSSLSPSHEARYQEWMEGPTTLILVEGFKKHLSPRVSRVLGLPKLTAWLNHRYYQLGRSLYDSGYITNLVIPAENQTSSSGEVSMRILRASMETGLIWQYSIEDHRIVVTCRTLDLPATIAAFEKIVSPKAPPGDQ
ncbi:MAG: hypothetical protein JNK85_05860 [Verrucomicrobiales bacterium]|nr:hypothetical protein [Verrucomicrobiales bacterium]